MFLPAFIRTLVESYFENPVEGTCAVLYVEIKEFTMLLLKDKVIWVLTPYRLVNIHGRFQGSWCLNLQSQPGKGGFRSCRRLGNEVVPEL